MNQKHKKINNMTLHEDPEIKKINERLKEDMLDYMEDGETQYTQKDVEYCMMLITNYLNEIEHAGSREEAMRIVEKTVGSFNELNERCQYQLIETDQREDIAEIIILAGSLKGFNERDEDITEEWREW